jgi:hypothetical protein
MADAGISVEGLGALMQTHVDEVREWQATPGDLSKALADRIHWHLAVLDHERRMRESGLPTCPWAEAHETKMSQAGGMKELGRLMTELEAHVASCDICRRREAFAATLPPLPRPPMPFYLKALGTVALRVQRLPGWAQPAATGALIAGGITLVRALFVLALQPRRLNATLLLAVLAAIGVGAYGGLAGGLAYTLVRARARRFGRLGDYITGIVCAYATLLAFGVPLALFAHDDTFRSFEGWVIFFVGATVFGIVIGRRWFRGVAPPPPADA